MGGGNAEIAFSPDGRWLVNGESTQFTFWDTETWTATHIVPRQSGTELPAKVVFSRDGSLLAVTSSSHEIKLLAPDVGTEIATLSSPDPRHINWLAIQHSNRLLAAATRDGVVQLWNLKSLFSHLAAMNLDQIDVAPTGGAPFAPSGRSLTGLVTLTVVGAVLALLLGAFLLRRNRRLVQGYFQVDALAAQQNQELAQAEAEIMHGRKMEALGTLAAGIAHDFNNLLSVIRMANELTRRENQADPDIQENATVVEQAVSQGKLVVKSMLGYSRDEDAEIRRCSLAELVEDAVPMLSQQFLSGITLTLELDCQAPLVSGSRARIQQILLNLIVNASEAMDKQGRLQLGVRAAHPPQNPLALRPAPAAEYVELSVTDDGPGIPEAIRDRIFEPFFSTKAAGTTRGTGLGLSLVYTIAQQHGYGIQVESEPHSGSTFRILFPAATDTEPESPNSPTPRSQTSIQSAQP